MYADTMKRGLIITGGESPPEQIIRREAGQSSIIVAADSGFDTALRCGVTPDFVVGDMDSIASSSQLESFPDDRVKRYSHDKDDTDTEIAIQLARDKGMPYIVLVGGGGGRLDHLIGILSLFDRDNRPDEWYTENEHIISISADFELKDAAGCRVSFFPAGKERCTMTSGGLKWPLDGLSWEKGDVGISNEITGNRMTIHMKTGRLIMVCSLDVEIS